MRVSGDMVHRSYTPIKEGPGYFEIMIKRYENGPISNKMHLSLPGDQIHMRGFMGSYTYTANKYPTILMISGGTGIAPMYPVCVTMLPKLTPDFE